MPLKNEFCELLPNSMATLVNIAKVKGPIQVSVLTTSCQPTSIPDNHQQKLHLQPNISDSYPRVLRKFHQCHPKPILYNCITKFTGKERPKNAAFSRKSPGKAPKPPPTETRPSSPPKPPLELRDAGEPPETSRSPTL